MQQRTSANYAMLFLLMSIFVSTHAVFASPQNISFQSRIYKPDGTPLEASGVQFKFSLMNPLSTCVIYSETFSSIDMTGSSGSIVLALGAGTRSYPVAGGMTWFDAFNNATANFTCQSSGTFSPTLVDQRRLVMQFNDGTGWQTLPPMDINSVPYSMFAQTAETVPLTGIPQGGAVTGQVLKWNGTSWAASSDDTAGGGAVISTSSANAYLTITNPNTTPSFTVNVGTGTNTLAAGDDSRIVGAFQAATALSGDLTGTLPNPTIAAGAVTNAKIASVAWGKVTSTPTTIAGYNISDALSTGTTYSGDVTGTYNALALNTIGAGGTGSKITYDTKGRVTGSANLSSADITTALGFTPTAGASLIGFTNTSNTALGDGALASPSLSMGYNTATGYRSLNANTSGGYNTAVGDLALQLNTTGSNNTATGARTLRQNTTGGSNTGTGYGALENNTTGTYNTGTGGAALSSNTTGQFNNASGYGSLMFNTTGNYNSASGPYALMYNTTGTNNTAEGFYALSKNKAKSESTAVGYSSMYYADDTTSASVSYNTAIGAYSLQGSTTAANNSGIKNTAVGHSALMGMTSGAGNIGLGYNAGSAITTGNNNVVIGSNTGSSIAGLSNIILLADGAGNERMRVDSTGKVGIGTTAPNFSLDVSGDINVTGNFKVNGVNFTGGGGSGGMSSDLTSAQIFVGNASNVAQGQVLSGDASITNAGVLTVTSLRGKPLDVTLPSVSGQVMVWDQTAGKWAINNLRMQDLKNTWGGSQMFPAGACTSNQSLAWSSITDAFTCQNITGLAGSVITTGTISADRMPAASGSADGIVNQIAQTFAGAKTFLSNVFIQGTLGVSGDVTTAGAVKADYIKVAQTSATCDGSTEGALRYNTTSKKMEFCNGTTWGLVSRGATAEITTSGSYADGGGGNPQMNYVYTLIYNSGTDISTIYVNAGNVVIGGTDTTGCVFDHADPYTAGTNAGVTIYITGCSGTGTVYVSILAGSATSVTGDPALAFGPSIDINVDHSGPNAPTSVTLGAVPSGLSRTPTISYVAPADVGSSTVWKYQTKIILTSDSSVVQDWTDHNSGFGVTGLSLAVTTQYSVLVRALDDYGNIGTTSAPVSWTTVGSVDCSVSPLVGDICNEGTIYLGSFNSGTYMTTPGGCTNSATPTCTGTDTLTKSWSDSTGSPTAYGVTTGANDENNGQSQSAMLATTYTDTYAAKYCEAMTFGGYSDWYLPAKNELNLLYVNKNVIDGLDVTGNWYWSSTDYDTPYSSGWVHEERFNDGAFGGGYYPGTNKTASYLIRCVRRY